MNLKVRIQKTMSFSTKNKWSSKIFSVTRYFTGYFKILDLKTYKLSPKSESFPDSFKMKLQTLRTLELSSFPLSIFIGKNYPAFQKNWKFSMENFPWKAILHSLVLTFCSLESKEASGTLTKISWKITAGRNYFCIIDY